MKLLRLTVCIGIIALLLSGCVGGDAPVQQGDTDAAGAPGAAKAPLSAYQLKDDASLYDDASEDEVVCFYLTVKQGSRADGTDNTFARVNSYKNTQGMMNVQKIYGSALVQIGDENGPQQGGVGYGLTRANATINVRGRTSTDYPQKSYRLTLYDNAGLWMGQRAIALNKHPSDPTRLRNALYFELLQDVPSMTSLRTRFVHLYVLDETDEENDGRFQDYGLFTQVELPNGRYLRNHGLSVDGNLYKAIMCEMLRYPDQIKLATDPAYDEQAFSQVLEPKTTNDHSKLIAMLDAVNDYSIPIETVVETYFDLDNLTSYVAFNLLMANPDSNAQNYLLYSPVNSSKWYYFCWDGDGSMSYYEDSLLDNAFRESDMERGIGNYWSVVLFNRMLRVDKYRQALTDKVETLHASITKEKITALIARYDAVVSPYVHAMPDAINLQVTQTQRDLILEHMPEDTDTAYAAYHDSLNRPMPFYMNDVAAENGALSLSWDASYDFDSELVQYRVEVAADWDFAADTVVFSAENLLLPETSFPLPPAGEYFWRVIAANESGYEQIAFDELTTALGSHSGVRTFTVTEDGRAVN